MSMKSIGAVTNEIKEKFYMDGIRYIEKECKVHGMTTHWSMSAKHSQCKKCEAEHLEAKRKENIDRIYSQYKTAMSRSGVNADGKRFDDWRFDAQQKERQEKIIQFLQAMAANFKPRGNNSKMKNVLFIGGTGSGKTMLANALAKDIYRNACRLDVENNTDAAYTGSTYCELISSSDITSRAKQSWGERGNSELQLIDSLASRQLLIIDDLGDNDTASNAEMAAADRSRIAQIISKRYQKRPTVITTNLTAEQAKEFLGDRAWDRLQENLVIIRCDWPSHRQSVAKIIEL